MEGFLSRNKINYIFHHLNMIINFPDDYRNNFVFVQNKNEISKYKNKIIFILNSDRLNINKIFYINDVPVLFPNGNGSSWFEEKEDNIIFYHDIFKSAFYLLSGYQETKKYKKDKLGRYPFEESIQYKLNFVEKPIVNYYLNIIKQAIILHSSRNSIKITTNNTFTKFGLLLTHDIDRTSYYNFNQFLYKFKQLFGLRHTFNSKFSIIKYIFSYPIVKLFRLSDPVWNIETLLKTEQKFNFKSAFYFLKKDQKNIDSNYFYSDKKIVKALNIIKNNNCEIGLHGTVRSAYSSKELIKLKDELESEIKTKVVGGRQHRLTYKHPETLINQEKAGLKYDSTLCFAEHQGFRNSFCLPFKLYNFKEDKMINDIWEFPLLIMDVTLFSYRKYSREEALYRINKLIEEIKKFNGLMTVLWHNGFEVDYNKKLVSNFYNEILKMMSENKCENILPKDLIKRLTQKEIVL